MQSITKLRKRIGQKKEPELVRTLLAAKKNKSWHEVAYKLSGSRRLYPSVNLEDIEENAKEGDVVVVPGKVLGVGDLHKRIRICALSFSASAIEKLKKTKSEQRTILEEIKHNPKAEGIKVLP